ncbi:MAG TPA: RHS repeat-associated core domain-containing protein, partial [Thermoanaerobaculia bacterium]
GAKTVYSYDSDGLLMATQDENHTTPNTRYAYDALDRLVTVTQTLAGAPGGVMLTRYDYDAHNNLVSVTDPNGNVTRYTYDDFGRMTAQESPVTGVTTYAYDPAGNLEWSTDARGAVTERTYDVLGRMVSATSTLGSSVETVSYTYDSPDGYGVGRIATMTDPSGMTAYRYDRRGLLTRETKTLLGDTFTLEYRYDANGNRAGLTYPSGRQLTYAYDHADRPRTVSGTLGGDSTAYISDAEYEPFGPVTRLAYGDGSIERRATYDLRDRMITLRVLAASQALVDHRYGYDAVRNITAIGDVADPRYNRSFAYDDLNRLTSSTTGSALWGSATWTYDAMGNRLASTLGGAASSFTYAGTTPKLVAATEQGRARTVLYDAAGNERSVGGNAFTYSPRNSLATADGLRYVYDGSGTRVAQVGLAVGPIITEQPRSRSVCPDAPATLSVRASGATAYQWESSADGSAWSEVADGRSSTVTVPGATAYYRVVTSNAAGSTTSDVAAITAVALATEPSSNVLYGDLTGDAAVNAADAAVLRAVIAGKQTLPVPLPVADLNGDSRVDALDLALVTAYATSSITCLPQFPTATTPFASLRSVTAAATLPNPTQYFFYTPEKNLLSHTDIHAGGGTPSIAIDYIWFAGMPVAQETLTTATTNFTFADHLGTPFLQTSTNGTTTWRADLEPYGDVWSMRTGDAPDQRLRFPGQEYDEQTPERAYNIFRWYRARWGRYTQRDPIVRMAALAPYEYAGNAPTVWTDPLGLLRTAPGPPPPNMGTVYCDGNGGIALQIDPRFSEQQYNCYAAVCLVLHEQRHASDFMMASGGRICQGQPRGTWIVYSSQREEDIYELRGNQAELDCLANERCNASQPCRTLIDERMRQLNADQANRRARLGATR